MTRASDHRPTRRVVNGGRYGALVAVVGEGYVAVRERRRRKALTLTWAAVYERAAELAAREALRQKRAKRKARRGLLRP